VKTGNRGDFLNSKKSENSLFIGDRVNALLLERKISVEWLSKEIKVRKSILLLYLSGKRKPDVNTIEKIAKALGISKTELLNSTSSSNQFSKYDLVEIFIDSLNEFQRRNSFSNIGTNEFAALLEMTSKLGGWKKVMKILDREIFEMDFRESNFQKNKKHLLAESTSRRSPPLKPTKKKAV
tara:strand:- start:2721 stop:3263 length:543 start_codon:yes stop_codon:yes gene_type:complete